MIRSRNLFHNNIRSGKFCAFTAAVAPLLPGASAARADTPLKPDEGKFILNLQEAEIGSDTFTIKAEGRVALSLGDRKIETDVDGRILLWSVPGQKLTEVRGRFEGVFSYNLSHLS